ncbi:vWA domain-containing protein [Borreliella valaisiana]|uniref:von Willebrand factor type A domain protein n=1 Tax=Borreliella valaisiana VS116 TaxID=445987 RepID=D6RX17_BORVA|nr:VWA domain-containing protein [Borreliella valaisiana]EEF82063.1 von Willebrand factor type A domain protein [Borreliella valaisiana VS116]
MSINNYSALYFFLILMWIFFVCMLDFRRNIPFFKTLSFMYGDNSYIQNYYIKKFLMSMFFIFSLIFLILSILDISWGQRAVEDERSKLRISFIFDISRSMLSVDEGKIINRLESAKNMISLILSNFESAEYSLTIFKGKPILVLPFSKDKNSLNKMLNYIEPDLISSPGSFLGDAVFSVVSSIQDDSYYNFLVILTDGDDWGENNYYRFSKFVSNLKLESFVVGIGGSNPVLFDYKSNVKDESGNLVKTVINEENLLLLASSLKGSYYNLYLKGINFVVNDIRNGIIRRTSNDIILVDVSRYKIFLVISLLFIFMYLFVRMIKWDETF